MFTLGSGHFILENNESIITDDSEEPSQRWGLPSMAQLRVWQLFSPQEGRAEKQAASTLYMLVFSDGERVDGNLIPPSSRASVRIH